MHVMLLTVHSMALSCSHRSTQIAGDLASHAAASQARPQRESESQAFLTSIDVKNQGNRPRGCNPKVLLESPKMVNSQKWLGEGAKGSLSSGSKSLPRVFCTIRNPFSTGATPFCTGATPLSLPGLKRPFAPSPNHFWEFTIFGLSSRTFGLQPLG